MIKPPRIDLATPSSPWGKLKTTLHDPIEPETGLLLVDFYDATLVPELVCAEPGLSPDRPRESWMRAPGRKAVLCWADKKLLGCWILKEHGIYYPCVDVSKGTAGALPILRHLAYRSFEEEGEELHAFTTNPLINAWVDHATDTPEKGRPVGMPLAKPVDGRIEWRSS